MNCGYAYVSMNCGYAYVSMNCGYAYVSMNCGYAYVSMNCVLCLCKYELRAMLITHMQDLKEVTQDVHYENFRAMRLGEAAVPREPGTPRSAKSLTRAKDASSLEIMEKERALQEKEAELRRMQEMIAKMQAQMQASHS
ncbi:predicted protein [Nematostella vectensis]|uniref:Septin-type G domain-containing protein n=1 Tax=Nematostella vectensis TaxID=45351 RepID=A7T898_NEMVE|nr:predicted protein [Nematostella vectensis]|eukprot:XP_001619896.1 hypothetical protein NEMVEDRAFT_v1g223708 [Nematostella vectensis]